MDKYDFIFIIRDIKNFFKNFNYKFLYKKYLIKKKEKLLMEYYILRTKRSNEYNIKHNKGKMECKPIEKVCELEKGKKYLWDLLKPLEKNK